MTGSLFNLRILYTTITFIACLAAGLYGALFFVSVAEKNHTDLLTDIAKAQTDLIERRLSRSLLATGFIANEVIEHGGVYPEFDRHAQQLLDTLGGISNLQLAPGGVVERIYPLAGNEQALGHNILQHDARREEALLAVTENRMILAGPFELVQGGVAVIGRQPVRITDASGEHFWGFASALIYLKDLIAITDLPDLARKGYQFELHKEADCKGLQPFFGSQAPLGEYRVERVISVPGGAWHLTISREHPGIQVYFLSSSLLGLLVAIILASAVYRILQQPELLQQRLQQRTAELEQLSSYDALTGLANRQLFQQELYNLQRSMQTYRQTAALLCLDLSGFKRLNDMLGHNAGDELLIAVGKQLRSQMGAMDMAARLGGGEFAVLVRDVNSTQRARRVAEYLQQSVSQAVQLYGEDVPVAAAIGITLLPDDSANVECWLQNAGLALTAAKRRGRDGILFFDPRIQAKVLDSWQLECELRQALDERQFVLFYQPQIDLQSRAVVGYEALIRWQHPSKGLQLPGHFIAQAEESGLIVPMGYWVLEEACRFINRQQQGGCEERFVSVNLSPAQFQDSHLMFRIEEIICRLQVDTRLLEIEVTESSLIEDVDQAIRVLNRMRSLGMSVSIDDFGTGYSSLAQLKHLPVNTLKIDRSFISGMKTESDDHQIVEAVIAMAHTLGLNVVAEGVETAEQLQVLQACRCDRVQGFLLGRPVAEDDLLITLPSLPDLDRLTA